MSERKVIASFVLGNSDSINIYEINHGIEDEVLAGHNNEEPEWLQIYYSVEHEDVEEEETPYFLWGEMPVSLNECMRIG